jgi:hypothetical protein
MSFQTYDQMTDKPTYRRRSAFPFLTVDDLPVCVLSDDILCAQEWAARTACELMLGRIR